MTSSLVMGVILGYGSVPDVIKAVKSYQEAKDSGPVIVVQNGLLKDEMDFISNKCPGAIIIRNLSNTGASGGRNIGIKKALSLGAEYIFFLDRDAWIEPNAIAILVEEAKINTNAALLSCLIFNPKTTNSIHSAGARFSPLNLSDVHFRDYPEEPITQVDYVITTAALVKADVFAEVGYFDERYFAYFEDLDWAERARRKGYHNFIVRSAIGYHNEERSRFHPLPVYYLTRNRLLFAQTYGFIRGRSDSKVFLVWRNTAFYLIRQLFAFRPLAITCLIAHWIGLIDYQKQKFGKGPDWIDHPSESLLENHLRDILLGSKFSALLRIIKNQIVHRGVKRNIHD